MRVAAAAVVVPSRTVTNDEVVDQIASLSTSFRGDLEKTLAQVSAALRRSGARRRRWRAAGETSLDLTARACRDAMGQLEAGATIDLLISAGVYTELAEPSSANVIGHAIGLDRVECFDLKQACDGWSKAVKIASALIENGTCRSVMVVNAEFPMTEGMGVYPQVFRLETAEQLEYRFPGFTLGEAAAAMVLARDEGNTWSFHNRSRNDLYDLCTIPMPWLREQPLASPRIGKDGPGVFTSYGAELRKHGLSLVVETFKEAGISPFKIDILFTHSSSKADWREAARQIGLADRIFDIYVEFGNVVSAAVPAAMALALKEGALTRGQQVAALVASAGMSFTTTSFTF
jgi:acyl-CoA:acyl-CoA alkyltransferase